MFNVQLDRKADKLVITIDLSKENGLSTSGKTTIIASTHGNADIPGMPGAKVGVNAFKYPER